MTAKRSGKLGIISLAGLLFLSAGANAFADDPRFYWRAHSGLIGPSGSIQNPGDDGDPSPTVEPLVASVSQPSLAYEVGAQSEPFAVTGGVAPYSWSGVNLPDPAVTVSPDGMLQASVPGTWTSLSVMVTDSATPPSHAPVTFNLAASYPPLVATVSQPSLAYEVGEPAEPFTATGGLPPYVWTSVNLPPEVTLTTGGVLKASTPGTWGALQVSVSDTAVPPSTPATVSFSLVASYPPSNLMAWGNQVSGRLGNGATTNSLATPGVVGSPVKWSTVQSGYDFSCGIQSGQLSCWGANGSGQLGTGDKVSKVTPTQIGSGSDWSALATGNATACGIRSSQLWCWGAGDHNGTGAEKLAPSQVGSGSGWQAVTAGASHNCGVRSGQLYCWGLGQYGRLGTNNQSSSLTPVLVGSDSDWTAVAAGQYHSCGIRSGQLFCWGYGASGQLGLGVDTANKLVPTRVGASSDWTSVSAGYSHSCGIRSGQLYCWGLNGAGRLGDTTQSSRNAPTRVGTDADWVLVSAADTHTCGIRSPGRLYCWGDATGGRLGNGASSGSFSSPVAIMPAKEWLSVSANYDHSLGMAAN